MSKTITLRYIPTTDDHIQGMRTFLLHIARMRILFLVFALAFLAGVLLLFISDNLTIAAVVLISLFPLLAFVLFVFSPMMLRRRVDRDRRLRAEREWELNDDQITIRNKFAEVSFEWSAFNVVKETSEQYVFISGTFIFLPKRAFESSEQESAFRDLVKRHIKKVQLNAA
jgi:hypothetical protein